METNKESQNKKQEKSILEFSDKEKQEKIISTLFSDNFYSQIKLSFEELAPHIVTVINTHLIHDSKNPIKTRFNEFVHFEPDPRMIERNGFTVAQIKYASHFVTTLLPIGDDPNIKKRMYDGSKNKALQFLIPTLLSEDVERFYQKENIKEKRNEAIVYAKQIKIDKVRCVILITEITIEGNVRSITFMPKKDAKYIEKQKASGDWSDASVIFELPERTSPPNKNDIKATGGGLRQNTHNKDSQNISKNKSMAKKDNTIIYTAHPENGEPLVDVEVRDNGDIYYQGKKYTFLEFFKLYESRENTIPKSMKKQSGGGFDSAGNPMGFEPEYAMDQYQEKWNAYHVAYLKLFNGKPGDTVHTIDVAAENEAGAKIAAQKRVPYPIEVQSVRKFFRSGGNIPFIGEGTYIHYPKRNWLFKVVKEEGPGFYSNVYGILYMKGESRNRVEWARARNEIKHDIETGEAQIVPKEKGEQLSIDYGKVNTKFAGGGKLRYFVTYDIGKGHEKKNFDTLQEADEWAQKNAPGYSNVYSTRGTFKTTKTEFTYRNGKGRIYEHGGGFKQTIDFNKLSDAQLTELYIENIGYDPFEDGGATREEVIEVLSTSPEEIKFPSLIGEINLQIQRHEHNPSYDEGGEEINKIFERFNNEVFVIDDDYPAGEYLLGATPIEQLQYLKKRIIDMETGGKEYGLKKKSGGPVQAGSFEKRSDIIYDQLGGRRTMFMIGARDIFSAEQGNALVFKFMRNPSKANYCRITYNEGTDTYSMEFGRIHGNDYKILKTYEDVYAEDLQRIFSSHTGLVLRLKSGGKAGSSDALDLESKKVTKGTAVEIREYIRKEHKALSPELLNFYEVVAGLIEIQLRKPAADRMTMEEIITRAYNFEQILTEGGAQGFEVIKMAEGGELDNIESFTIIDHDQEGEEDEMIEGLSQNEVVDFANTLIENEEQEIELVESMPEALAFIELEFECTVVPKMKKGGPVIDDKMTIPTSYGTLYDLRVPLGSDIGDRENKLRDLFLENDGRVDKKMLDKTIKYLSKNAPSWQKAWNSYKKTMEITVQGNEYVNPFFKSGGKPGKKSESDFQLDQAVIHHHIGYEGKPDEEAGSVVMNPELYRDNRTGKSYPPNTVKGISLYRDKNYSGSASRFIIPNWNNVETFYQANKRQEKNQKFEITKAQTFKPGGSVGKKHSSKQIEQAALAYVLGVEAFKAGKKRIPALDKDLVNLIAGNEIGESMPALRAWNSGWDNANLGKLSGGNETYRKGGKMCPVGMEVQTVIFDKSVFPRREKAVEWAKEHGYNALLSTVDETADFWRLRQASPHKFKKDSFRTIEFTTGVKAVVACPIPKLSKRKK